DRLLQVFVRLRVLLVAAPQVLDRRADVERHVLDNVDALHAARMLVVVARMIYRLGVVVLRLDGQLQLQLLHHAASGSVTSSGCLSLLTSSRNPAAFLCPPPPNFL